MEVVEYHLGNMLTRSCLRLLENEISKLPNAELLILQLGYARVKLPRQLKPELDLLIKKLDFQILKDADQILVERIKSAAIELIFHANNASSLIRNSDYISDKLGVPYDKLSRSFSRIKGQTLEHYLIQLKVEKIKEMLIAQEFTLSEIAYQMGYSSVQYLSNQFKKSTGLTVSAFLQSPQKWRIPLEDL